MNYYTGGCIDYIKNDCISSYKLYDDLNELKYDLNYKICFLINQCFNVTPKNEYLYVLVLDKIKKRSGKVVFKTDTSDALDSAYIDINSNTDVLFEQELIINDHKSILFVKYNNTIDIYSKIKNNNYIYTTQKMVHLYKFFIHNLYTSTHVDPFEPFELNNQHNEQKSLWSSSSTVESISDSCNFNVFVDRKLPKEKSIKILNKIVDTGSKVKNIPGCNLFLNELKQRIQNINID
jgi:hypothetical protein